MSAGRARRMAAVVAFAGACASEISAQDQPAGASVPASTDAIAEAKKEFENLKSGRDAALLPKGALPRVNLPALPPTVPPMGGTTKQKIAAPEPKSSSWLVDAMEKQEDSRDARGQISRSRDRQGKSAVRGDDLETEDPAARDSMLARENEERDTPVVINPLTRYLGDWMTPQDYALLKPGLKSFEPGVGANNSTGLGTPVSSGTPGGLSDFSISGIGSSQPRVIPPSTRENPYLQSLKPDVSASAVVVSSKSVSLPPMSAPRPVTIAPPPPTPPAPTKIPDFVKPPTDDRYFKQLKRF